MKLKIAKWIGDIIGMTLLDIRYQSPRGKGITSSVASTGVLALT